MLIICWIEKKYGKFCVLDFAESLVHTLELPCLWAPCCVINKMYFFTCYFVLCSQFFPLYSLLSSFCLHFIHYLVCASGWCAICHPGACCLALNFRCSHWLVQSPWFTVPPILNEHWWCSGYHIRDWEMHKHKSYHWEDICVLRNKQITQNNVANTWWCYMRITYGQKTWMISIWLSLLLILV